MVNVLHGLFKSLPHQSGYTLRSKYIVEGQRALNINSMVVTPPLYKRTVQENINNIDYYRAKGNVKVLLKLPFIKHIYSMYVFEKEIEEIVKKRNIDILHAHSSFFVGVPIMKIARKYNIPYIYEIRGLWEDTGVSSGTMKENGFLYKYYRSKENQVIKNANAVITISSGLKNDINKRELRKDDIKIIPNGVNLQNFDKRVSELEVQNKKEKLNLTDSTIIGYISSFTRMEGIEYLIQSIKLLKEDKNIKLLLVGDGPEINNLKEITTRENLTKKVVFTGRVPHDEILLYYRLIDIFVIPRIGSRVTNIVTPLKPLEAMASKKAIIVSNVGGLNELIINNRTGLTFENKNVIDLADKLNLLINDKNKRLKLGENAFKWVSENRQWKNIVKSYSSVYREIKKKIDYSYLGK